MPKITNKEFEDLKQLREIKTAASEVIRSRKDDEVLQSEYSAKLDALDAALNPGPRRPSVEELLDVFIDENKSEDAVISLLRTILHHINSVLDRCNQKGGAGATDARATVSTLRSDKFFYGEELRKLMEKEENGG